MQLRPCEWTCTSDGRSITVGQGWRARDFPLNAQHPLHHYCIMMATPSVVLAEWDWRCVTSLSPSFITFKHFQKPRWTFLQSAYSFAYSVNRLNSQLLIMQVKIFFSNFCFSTFDTKWFWKLPYFLLNKKFLRLKSDKINLTTNSIQSGLNLIFSIIHLNIYKV